MTRRISLLVVLALVLIMPAMAQVAQKTNDPVLFSVEGIPVHVSEFTYIYSKTNGKNADFSKKSLDEYLDLYVKFKLKVQKAREMRLDTIATLKEELAGYRRQLADSYLIDKSVTERLVKEAYDRAQQDVEISHILVSLKPDAAPADTMQAYERAMAIKKRIEGGTAFEAVAKEVSDDKSAEKNGGRIGFVTAPFPNGLYALETAAYTLAVGKVSKPLRSPSGYHLLMVHSRRPARGEVEAAHILIRKAQDDPNKAKIRIDSIYKLIQGGAMFDDLARTLSEDRQTAANNGYVGFFGINRYERSFEDAAFGLAKDGDISKPFETSVGWHIMKRISLKPIQPFNVEKSRLEQRITKDPRFEEAKQSFVQRLKQENGFRENMQVLEKYVVTLPDTFLTFRWKPPVPSTETLFTYGKTNKASLGDYTEFLGRASRQRIRDNRDSDPASVARKLYLDFVNEQVLKFEETQLENKYPEFKSLMREYEEGILLFEATKLEVWDKASQDTVGLTKFFETVRGKYRWNERAVTSIYRISGNYRDKVPAIREYAKTHNADEVKAQFNTPTEAIVNTEEAYIEKDKNSELRGVAWKVGEMSPYDDKETGDPNAAKTKTIKFYKIEKILPPADKTLKEARGYVVADYQDQLEREWVEELRKAYKVDISQKVLEGLVGKKQ